MRRVVWVLVFALALCAPASARESEIAADGTVYVVGPFADPVEGLLRATPDGTRVRGFGRDGFVAVRGRHVALLPDGGVAVAGYEPTGVVRVSRYDAGGALTGSVATWTPLDVLEDVRSLGDGRLLLAGLAHNGPDWRLVLVVLRADGSFDPAFGDGGVARSQGTLAHPPLSGEPRPTKPIGVADREVGGQPASVLTDGRILVGGPELVARFTAAGRPDTSWGGDGEVTVGDGEGIVAAAGDGAWVVEGVDDTHVRLHHLDASGSEDRAATYAVPGVGSVKDARALADGRLAFLLWPFGSQSSQPYGLSADGSALTAGPAADSTGYSDLHVLGDELVTVGPSGRLYRVTRYGATLHRTGGAALNIVDTGPVVTIVSGPSRARGAVTGPEDRFRFALEQRPEDLGFATIMCDAGGLPHPCGTDLTFRPPDGIASLTVWGVGIHGVPGPTVRYLWHANAAAPITTVRSRPRRATGSRSARIIFGTSEKATVRCRIDGAPARVCRSPLRLRGLRPGPHRVTLIATDEAPSVERRPPTVAWRVGPSLTLSSRGVATLLALRSGRATLRVTDLRTRRATVRRVALRARRTRTLALQASRLRVTVRLPGVSRPLTRAVG